MERNTATTPPKLLIGDRFYKVADKKKEVLQLVTHPPHKTLHQTYNYWYITDTDKHPQAIKWNTPVIFLRHTT